MICIIMILFNGWCRMRMRPAHLVSYAFLYTTEGNDKRARNSVNSMIDRHKDFKIGGFVFISKRRFCPVLKIGGLMSHLIESFTEVCGNMQVIKRP